ncbi:glutathione-S-transferase [Mycena filopes]|nr:glutathione-S-transferase [Mycena filopes]
MAIPDEDIFPHATGNATCNLFYAGWFCPYVQRTWITLEEKGVPYQYKEVNPYKKEKHFLDINPKGLVPAVEYHGKALYESLVLCEFLDDAYPERTQILPGDAYTKAYARIWIDFVSKSFVPAFMRLTQAQDAAKQDQARVELYDALRKFAAQAKGPYFLGDEFSLVDVAIVPWITRDYILAEHRAYRREDVSPEWKRYADHVEQRESVVKTKSDKYAKIYGRPAKAIRAGRAIP